MSDRLVPFRVRRRVEFRDTDAAGIVHFSAFFPMMEAAEHELLRSLGVAVLPAHDAASRLTFPRVAVSCSFQGPARFEDWLDIDVSVAKIGQTSITYHFGIHCEDRPIATGQFTVVCCYLTHGGELRKADVPESLRNQLSTYQHSNRLSEKGV